MRKRPKEYVNWNPFALAQKFTNSRGRVSSLSESNDELLIKFANCGKEVDSQEEGTAGSSTYKIQEVQGHEDLVSIKINEVLFVGDQVCGKGVLWKQGDTFEDVTKTLSLRDGGDSRRNSMPSGSKGDTVERMSISDNQIKNCNRLALEKLSKEAATKTWDLGKSFGVTYQGDEEEVIGNIIEMEERDRNIVSSMGAQRGS